MKPTLPASPLHSFRLLISFFLLFVFIQPATPLAARATLPDAKGQTDLTGPAGSGEFGRQVVALPNGNIVVADPAYSSGGEANLGAVYLYDGSTLELISTLTGSQANDQVGSNWLVVLSSGDYLVSSPMWSKGAEAGVGAVTWCSQTTGCQGQVSVDNSLVGSTAGDSLGSQYILALETGGYFIFSPYWDNGALADAGAITHCQAPQGCKGLVSSDNSLVGGSANDMVGKSSLFYSGSNYLINNPHYDNGSVVNAGAWTYCGSQARPCYGVVSASNSLVGTSPGELGYSNPRYFPNGDYVIRAPYWDNDGLTDVGAVIACQAAAGGCTGVITADNSLVGSTSGDRVGSGGVFSDQDNNYAVYSPNWSNGPVEKVGAVTACSSLSPCTGPVSDFNSLTGSTAFDQVGSGWEYEYSPSGSYYLVISAGWDKGLQANAGAVTWCSFSDGCTGPVSADNSLVGSSAGDGSWIEVRTSYGGGSYIVGFPSWDGLSYQDVGAVRVCPATGGGCTGEFTPLNSLSGSHGNDRVGSFVSSPGPNRFIIGSSNWTNGDQFRAGALTLCSSLAGCTGTVSPVNSLVGSRTDDQVGSGSFTWSEDLSAVLFTSFSWDNGDIEDAGALTFCRFDGSCTGYLSSDNSLVGSQTGDFLNGYSFGFVKDGNYVAAFPQWDNGALTDAGAVTWCSRAAGGCTGPVTPQNSLFGARANDRLGSSGIIFLENGDYAALSPYWSDGERPNLGAVTWCSGTAGCQGVVSDENSLVGSSENDSLGEGDYDYFDDGSYIIHSGSFDSPGAVDGGLVAWCESESGCQGTPPQLQYAVMGGAPDRGGELVYAYDAPHKRLVVGRPGENRVTVLSLVPDEPPPPPTETHELYLPMVRKP